jgi:hypothetical protein
VLKMHVTAFHSNHFFFSEEFYQLVPTIPSITHTPLNTHTTAQSSPGPLPAPPPPAYDDSPAEDPPDLPPMYHKLQQIYTLELNAKKLKYLQNAYLFNYSSTTDQRSRKLMSSAATVPARAELYLASAGFRGASGSNKFISIFANYIYQQQKQTNKKKNFSRRKSSIIERFKVLPNREV